MALRGRVAGRILRSIAALLCVQRIYAQTRSWPCGPCWCESWAAPGASEGASCSGSGVLDIPPDIPANISSLKLTGTSISTLKAGRLARHTDLVVLYISLDVSLSRIEKGAFGGLLNLTDLIINHCKNLRTIDSAVFTEFRQLRTIDLRYNSLVSLPDFSAFVNLQSTMPVRLNLDNNTIVKIDSREWCKTSSGCSSVVLFNQVTIRSNYLEEIDELAFAGSRIASLDLSDNIHLSILHSSAFEGILSLETLSLSNTSISSFPSSGLQNIKELRLENTPSLKTLPATVHYQELRRAYVHYPHLCCAFQYPKIQNEIMYEKIKKLQEESCAAATSTENEVTSIKSTAAAGRSARLTTQLRSRRAAANNGSSSKLAGGSSWGAILGRRPSTAFTTSTPKSGRRPGSTSNNNNNNNPWLANSSSESQQQQHNPCAADDWNLHLWREHNFRCMPAPNAFNPCIDVLEADWLRCVMWVSALLTVLGNASVLLLTLFVKAPMTVTKFLVCNLVLADFFLGTYLIALASEDARTTGNYFNHALSWQYGGSCDAVGFLAVFGAELSVFTLVIITLERWYTISNAIQLTKRIKMRHAVCIMCCGWLFCFLIAVAPTAGASSYQVTSLCLPFRYESATDKGYVIFLLAVNVAAFAVVLACYASMYAQVRRSSCLVNKSDTEVAKRMAYLVAIDFMCWGPVAIVAALSAGGVNINVPRLSGSSLTHAKIVLALFFPINALANPFLYAILTRQFQNDVVSTFYRWGICQKEFMSYAMDTFGHSSSSAGRGARSSPCARLRAVATSAPESLATESTHMQCGAADPAELLRRGSSSAKEGGGSGSSSCDHISPPTLPTVAWSNEVGDNHGRPTCCCSRSSSSSSSSSEPRLDRATREPQPPPPGRCRCSSAAADVSTRRLLSVYATLSHHSGRRPGAAAAACSCSRHRPDQHVGCSGCSDSVAAAAAAAAAEGSKEPPSCCSCCCCSSPCRHAATGDSNWHAQRRNSLAVGSSSSAGLVPSQPQLGLQPESEQEALLAVESPDVTPCHVPAARDVDVSRKPAKGLYTGQQRGSSDVDPAHGCTCLPA